jgi:pyruvate-formate lyase-activating enzyme
MILFNKKIELKTQHCQLFDYDISPVRCPYVNIQVKIKGCNANCDFCESKDKGTFNEDKYFEKLKLISKKIRIYKLNFTGGEPTINFERLKRLVLKTREILPDAFMVINTNGYNFEKLFENDFYKNLDSIQLSRHHYIDKINNKILGFQSISKEIIKLISSKLETKRMFSLSCNLLRGYIDNEVEIFKYLEDSAYMDVRWVGFVTLIPLNQYCINNNIKFEDLNLKSDRLVLTKHWKNGEKCECSNYVYIPTDLSDPIRVYNKRTARTDINFILVFDGENFNAGFTNNFLI